MTTQIYVNLPVKNVERSRVFFSALGYSFNPQDHGFMYGHGFEDLDGHIWELMHMDPNAAPPSA